MDGATQRLHGRHRLASHTTSWRFCAGADLGRAQKAAAVNRTMLARAWAMGAGPPAGLVTIDPDATLVDTYGPGKEGSTFTHRGETGLSPLIGVCGETGDVLAVRARGGNAHPGRAIAGFIRECAAAIPAAVREGTNLWVRVDSAGYQHDVFRAVEQLGAVFTITAPQRSNVRDAVRALAADPDTAWRTALNAEADKGSEIAETMIDFGGRKASTRRRLRLIVRRQPACCGEQLSFDDVDGYRFHAVVTNLPALFATAEMVEAHHRLRGGVPEDTIRQLKEDFGLDHAHCRTSSGTGCGGTPPPWPTTPPAGSRPSRYLASSGAAAGNGSVSHSSTSPPASSPAPANCGCASPAATPGPPASSKRSPASGASPHTPEPDRRLTAATGPPQDTPPRRVPPTAPPSTPIAPDPSARISTKRAGSSHPAAISGSDSSRRESGVAGIGRGTPFLIVGGGIAATSVRPFA